MCDTQEMHIWHISSHEYAHQEIHISQDIWHTRRYTSGTGYMAHQEIHISSHECAHTDCTPGGAQASSKQVHIQFATGCMNT